MNITNTMPDIQGGIHTVDSLATKSDRWLMIALLFVGIIAVSVAFRYFMKQLEAVQKKADDNSAAFQTSLISIVEGNRVAMDNINAGLAANTKATQEHTEIIRGLRATCEANWKANIQRGAAAVIMFAFLLFATGCQQITVRDPGNNNRLLSVTGPAWPWQNTSQALEKFRMTQRGTNFMTVSMDGLSDEVKSDTNAIFFNGLGNAIGSAIKAAK